MLFDLKRRKKKCLAAILVSNSKTNFVINYTLIKGNYLLLFLVFIIHKHGIVQMRKKNLVARPKFLAADKAHLCFPPLLPMHTHYLCFF